MARRRTPSIAYSHVLGSPAAAVLGAVLVVGILAYPLAREVLSISHGQAPLAYWLSALLALPLLLSLLEMASDSRDRCSPYHLARDGRRRRLFAVGWLLLASNVALLGLLARVLAEVLVAVLARFLPEVPDLAFFFPGVGFFLFLRLTTGGGESHRQRARLSAFVLAVFVALLSWAFLEAGASTEAPLPVRAPAHRLGSVALLASSLWGVVLLLEMRPLLQRPRRGLPAALAMAWLVPHLLIGAVMILVARDPGLITGHWLAEAAWGPGLPEILHLAVALGLVGIGLVETGFLGRRLSHEMAADGVLSSTFDEAPSERHSAHTASGILCGLSVVLALAFPPLRLAAFASSALLMAFAVLLWQELGRREEARQGRRFRLPAHPSIPALALVTAVFLATIQPGSMHPALAAWMLAGAAYFFLVARARMAGVERDDALFGTIESKDGHRYRVLVALGSTAKDLGLIELGAARAAARGGELVVLRVLVSDEPHALATRHEARREWRRLDRTVAAAPIGDLAALSLVRIAPTAAEGILESVAEEEIDFVILGWHGESEEETPTVQDVFRATRKPLAVARRWPGEPDAEVLVTTAGGLHAAAALDLAGSWSQATGGRVALVSVPAKGRSPAEAAAAFEETTARLEEVPEHSSRVLPRGDVDDVLLDEGKGESQLFVGASEDPLLGRALLSGLPFRLLLRYPGPILVVKAGEGEGRFWLRRLWDWISHPLPALEPQDRAEVFAEMRRKATADVDYYLLIFFASAIASFGLVLDSSAVIIGAMLVAPLMSPILALGCGLVHGSVVMVRRSVASTAKGMGVALLTGMATALLLPAQPPTGEILARGQPSLIDLLVAIASGAAGAYASSRRSLSAALPGVAIAVALVPPLCASGWALGASHFGLAAGALLLFLTNLSAIVLVGAFLFLLLGFRPRRAERRSLVQRAFLAAVLAIAVVSIPLALQTGESVRSRELDRAVRAQVELLLHDCWQLEALDLDLGSRPAVVTLKVLERREPDAQSLRELQTRLSLVLEEPLRLRVRSQPIREVVLEPDEGSAHEP